MNLRIKLQLAKCDPVPRGVFTIHQLAEREGYSSENSLRPMLRAALKAGLLVAVRLRRPWGDSQTRVITHYRYTKNAK